MNENTDDILDSIETSPSPELFLSPSEIHSLHSPQGPTHVIDLTREPDSPARSQARLGPIHISSPAAGNPRRANLQRISHPQIRRTGGPSVGPSMNVIDLTADYLEEEQSYFGGQVGRRVHQANERGVTSQQPALGSQQSFPTFSSFSGILRGNLGGNIAFDSINSTVSHLAVARESSPKPRLSPPPPTREGFTRDTCTDPEKESESVFVCPACSKELAYDLAGTVKQSSVSTYNEERSQGLRVHHFWAVKNCGHVYCADCYENRKLAKANHDGVYLCSSGERPADLRCVVEGCESLVEEDTEWVGIFF